MALQKQENVVRRKRGAIRFDTEKITKEAAKEIVQANRAQTAQNDSTTQKVKREKRKKKTPEASRKTKPNTEDEAAPPTTKKPKKRKMNNDKQETKAEETKEPTIEAEETIANADDNEAETAPKKPKEESIRAKKRKRFAQLQEEKRIKSELACQEKTLNYLSKWKHSRSEWKFEKLRQIWLQNNIYDSDNLPESFWNTLLEYFRHSKGKARDTILQDALKIVEDGVSEQDKMRRARDIIQNLQE